MKAVVQDTFGPPDVLRLEEVDPPAVDADGVLVRVRAASVNPADWHAMRGSPWFARPMFGLRRPKQRTPGVDLAGVVEAVGENVTHLRPGDEIFGARSGSFAELVCGGKNFIPKPTALSFEEAGSIAIAGCTALQALRDKGGLQAGQRVLINGAAGGVGTFAVQIAKAMGGHVTGVCSTRNVELVRSLGADDVVDYTTDDFAHRGVRHDLVIDLVGNRSTADLRRVLTPKGTAVLIGGGGNLVDMVAPLVVARFVSQRLVTFTAKINAEDLAALGELAEAGKLTPVIDRTYPLEEAAEAIRYLETGHVRGKVVVTM
ncbi:MAG: NAD(P)-dependent alcohol dehydrogenase [Gaiellaceae bacterium]